MAKPLVLPLRASTERSLVGGKAQGLARLIRSGFRVPDGICLTTTAYAGWLEKADVDATLLWKQLKQSGEEERRNLLRQVSARLAQSAMSAALAEALAKELAGLGVMSSQLWAVRSSATNEDETTQSMAGQYETRLGVSREELAQAIVACWASLWTAHSVEICLRTTRTEEPPSMAVVVQPLIAATAAGVVFSSHPVTGRDDHVIINAVPGLGGALVAGQVTPDEFVVRCPPNDQEWIVDHRRIASKTEALRVTAGGVAKEVLTGSAVTDPALSDVQVVELAQLAKHVERAFGYPHDLEWALDDQGYWLLQARPITTISSDLTVERSDWSRANFKETLPDLPSPMGLSFLQEYMEDNMLRHYRELGCDIPAGLSAVRVVRGRPFINVTLFQSLVAQLGSDPALVTEQMGGQGQVQARLHKRLPVVRLARAGVMALWKMRQAVRRAPLWFEEMKRMAEEPTGPDPVSDRLRWLLQEGERIDQRLRLNDPTFAIAAGVGQGLEVLGTLLARWFPTEWRTLLNAALQGQGTVISAQQIFWLGELADLANGEPAARDFFLRDPWEPAGYLHALAGTRFIREWERFLHAYGHRAVGESDVMTPRHAERPEVVLAVVRGYLQSGTATSSREVFARQEATRTGALTRIRQRVRWWPGAWTLFHWWYRRLCRFLALREANRHHLMYFLVAVRRLMREVGTILVQQGYLAACDDIYYLTTQEFRSLADQPQRDWRPVVAIRQRQREADAAVRVPDYLEGGTLNGQEVAVETGDPNCFCGIPISPGEAEGLVCVVRRTEDLAKIRRGVILVLPVIDPGLTPYFGLVAGVIAEMGGTLSHGAIIAREYGVPAIANIPNVTMRLHDGDWILLDGTTGTIRRRVN